MSPGSIIIANDLVGIIVDAIDDCYVIATNDDSTVNVLKECCHEICNPNALAALLYVKLAKKRGKFK